VKNKLNYIMKNIYSTKSWNLKLYLSPPAQVKYMLFYQ